MTTRIDGLWLAFGFVLALGLSACGGGYGLPEPIAATESAMPQDAVAAAAALVERLRGGPGAQTPGVRFAPGAGTDPREADFAYRGFAVRRHALLRYAPGSAGENSRVAAGEIEFADALGRRTTALYYLDYRFAGGGIEIVEARAASLFALEPQSLMFVVPAEAVARSPGGLPRTHAGLMEFVVANAVDWAADPIAGGVRDYVVFAFLVDRVSPSSILEVKVSDDPNGIFGYKAASQYVDVDGWRIGIMPGRFALDSSGLYAKVVFAPGTEVGFGQRTARLVGLYPLDVREARRQPRN